MANVLQWNQSTNSFSVSGSTAITPVVGEGIDNNFSVPQTFGSAINQTASAGANNQSALLNTGDVFSDFIASGMQWDVPSPASLTSSMASGVATLNGTRTIVPAVGGYTFPASNDTYVSFNNAGEVAYQSVANGATAPTPNSGYVQTAKVVTSPIQSPAATLSTSTSGSLASGTYGVALVAYDATGYGAVGASGTVAVTSAQSGSGSIELSWVNPLNETSMDIYATTAGSTTLGLVASGVTGTSYTYTGSVAPGAAAPSTATSNAIQGVIPLLTPSSFSTSYFGIPKKTVSIYDFLTPEQASAARQYNPNCPDMSSQVQDFFDTLANEAVVGDNSPGLFICMKPITINSSNGVSFKGNGPASTMFAFPDFGPGISSINVYDPSSSSNSYFDLSGFKVAPPNINSSSIGIRFGNPSTNIEIMQGYLYSKANDIFVANFATNFDLVHCRQIKFDKISAWNPFNGGTNLNIWQNGLFTGDMNFDSCQLVAANFIGSNVSVNSTVSNANGTPGYGSVNGIKFTKTDIYAGNTSISITANNGANIGDVWFSAGCQQDGESNVMFSLSCAGGSVLTDVHFTDGYLVGGAQIPVEIVSSGGYTSSIFINGNNFNSSISSSYIFNIYADNYYISGLHVDDNNFASLQAGVVVVESTGMKDSSICNNTLIGNETSTGNTYAQTFFSAGNGERLNVSGNLGVVTGAFIEGVNNCTDSIFENNSGSTGTLTGATSGSVTWSMYQQSTNGKEVVLSVNGYENDTSTDQTITFPTPFAQQVAVIFNNSGLTVTASLSELTITAPNSNTAFNGVINLKGI